MSDERSEPEIPELKTLTMQAAPAPALEDRVVAALRKQGRIRTARPNWMRWAAAAAMAGVLFAAGWLAGGRQMTLSGETRMPEYLLLLRSGTMVEGSTTDEAARVREYGAWAGDLHRRGLLVSAEKLSDEAQVLSASAMTEGTAATSENAVRGFFLIRSSSTEEALRIARECPHLRHGGTIEVRPIVVTGR